MILSSGSQKTAPWKLCSATYDEAGGAVSIQLIPPGTDTAPSWPGAGVLYMIFSEASHSGEVLVAGGADEPTRSLIALGKSPGLGLIDVYILGEDGEPTTLWGKVTMDGTSVDTTSSDEGSLSAGMTYSDVHAFSAASNVTVNGSFAIEGSTFAATSGGNGGAAGNAGSGGGGAAGLECPQCAGFESTCKSDSVDPGSGMIGCYCASACLCACAGDATCAAQNAASAAKLGGNCGAL